ncbi:MAG TPA: ABC transporter permease [Acidimicrobiales bacterium]|nr:ABC transporter permease [Acidimicrobiales bacterium]
MLSSRFSTITRKSWADLRRRPARAVLTALTISMAVASFGILAMPSLMDRGMSSEVSSTRLYDLSVPVNNVVLSSAQFSALTRLPNVVAVAARSSFGTRAMSGAHRMNAEIWGVPDWTSGAWATQPVDRVALSGRVGTGQVLVDVQDSTDGIYSGGTGNTLRLQAADGSWRPVTVAGTAHSMAFSMDTLDNRLVLYATDPTVQALGGFRGVNYLEFRLQDTGHSAAVATAAEVRSFLARQSPPSHFSDLPSIRAPGDWPAKSIFDQRSKVLDILTGLAVISAALLLANTVRTMVAEQANEIAVMRAIGARRRDIRRSYLRTAGALGFLGSLLGVPLGIGLAYLLVDTFAKMIFGASPSFSVDWTVAVISGLAGIGGSMLAAWATLHRVLRAPVNEALNSEGLVSRFGASRLDRALASPAGLPAPVRMGLRNVARQKERSVTTIVQVALAVATLLGLISLGHAVSQTTKQSWAVLDYDVTLTSQSGGQWYGPAVVSSVRHQPGVAGVEAVDESQMSFAGQTLYELGVHSSTFIHETLTSGHWLSPAEERADASVMVAGSAFARLEHLHLGSQISVRAAAGPTRFTVVGIGGSNANNGFNVYTTLGAAQAADGRPGVANTLLVRAANKAHPAIDALATRLENWLGRAGYPSNSQVIYSDRAAGLAAANSMLVMVQGIGLVVVAISMLGLVNAITMGIIERTREIGVLRSLGARARDLRRMLRAETVTLAVAGFVLGVPLGWLVAQALRWLILLLTNERLPAPYTLADLGIALAGTLVLAVLVVVAPLRRATRLRPGQAIRYT